VKSPAVPVRPGCLPLLVLKYMVSVAQSALMSLVPEEEGEGV
jgi:hypothetical protein